MPQSSTTSFLVCGCSSPSSLSHYASLHHCHHHYHHHRKYTNGSVLRMHVDTVNTHVVSAIINVDQSVEKDWPLLILDHQVGTGMKL